MWQAEKYRCLLASRRNLSEMLIDSEYWLFLTLRTKIDKSVKKPSPQIAEVVYD